MAVSFYIPHGGRFHDDRRDFDLGKLAGLHCAQRRLSYTMDHERFPWRLRRCFMPKNLLAKVLCVVVIGAVAVLAFGDDEGPQQPWSKWKVADLARPMAPEVTPGTPSTQA